MSKPSSNPITQSDIKTYLSKYSDFSFELQVLKKFIDLGLECSHGGTYEDPVTSKSRQYDIRALLQKNVVRVHLSVECKNIRANFPLIVHCLKRKANENYNELIQTVKADSETQKANLVVLEKYSRSIRVKNRSLYRINQFVAKSSDQVGKRDNGDITSSDAEVFDKISQAINSAKDLISEARNLDMNNKQYYFTLVCPVLIIPDASLWQVKYSDDGGQIGEPGQINHISYYIDKSWTVGDNLTPLHYTLSHLEIVTYSEIQNFVEEYLGNYISVCYDAITRGGEFS